MKRLTVITLVFASLAILANADRIPVRPSGATSVITAVTAANGSIQARHDDGNGTVVDICEGFQLIQDEDARNLQVDPCGILLPDRTIHVGPSAHIAVNEIGVGHADSDQATVAPTTTAHTVGVIGVTNSGASGNSSFAIAASGSSVTGTASLVQGFNSTVTGDRSFSLGNTNSVLSGSSGALGTSNTSQGFGALAIGSGNNVNQAAAAVSPQVAAYALGNENTVDGALGAVGIGYRNSIDAQRGAVAIGDENTLLGTQTIAIGRSNTVDGADSPFAIGWDNDVNGSEGAFASGRRNTVTAIAGSAGIGSTNSVLGNDGSIGLGRLNQITANAIEGALALGNENVADANKTQLIGTSNTSTGAFGTARGHGNNVAALKSHALGNRANPQHDYAVVISAYEGDAAGDLFPSSAAREVSVYGEGGIRMITTPSTAGAIDGAVLAPNATAWAAISTRSAKDVFEEEVDYESVLQAFEETPISKWQYKHEKLKSKGGVDTSHVRHVGWMAEDFHAIAGQLGYREDAIETSDAVGILAAALKGEIAKRKELEAKIEKLLSQ